MEGNRRNRTSGFIAPIVEPITNAIDRMLVSAASYLVNGLDEGNKGPNVSFLVVPKKKGSDKRNGIGHAEAISVFTRKNRAKLPRRRGAVHGKRIRMNGNRVPGRPHG